MSGADAIPLEEARAYTALGRLAARRRARRRSSRSRPPVDSPWRFPLRARGQDAGEIFAIAGVVAALTFAAAADGAARLPFVHGWHWLWAGPATMLAWLVGLHLAGVLAVVVGRVIALVGIARRARPRTRTSFVFLALLTTWAAWAAGQPGWVRVFGSLWLVLVGANLVAFVWCAMRAADSRPGPGTLS